MPATSDDDTDEYLDDPISLNFEDRKIKSEIDQVINIESSDEESMYTSSYGKRNFVLPVTFFDISRNVRLLSKCKPLSISIVDCKSMYYRHPKYRQCRIDNLNSQFDVCTNASVEEDVEDKSDYEYEINNAIVEDTKIDMIEIANKPTDKTETNITSNNSNTTQNVLTIDSVDKRKHKENETTDKTETSITSNDTNTTQDGLTIDSVDKRKHKENKTTDKTETSITSNDTNTTQDGLTIDNVDKKKHREKERYQKKDATVEHTQINNIETTDNTNKTSNNKDTSQDRLKIDSVDKRKHKEKKRHRAPVGDSYYAKIEKRKEERKKDALKCKDLSKVDLKRNTGLVGLKITGPIFKQIIDTEKALIKTKSNSGENNCNKEISHESTNEKPESCVEEPFTGSKCNADNKNNKQSDMYTGKIIIGTKSNGTKDKYKEKTKYDKEKLPAHTKSNIVEDKNRTVTKTTNDQNKEVSSTEKTLTTTKTIPPSTIFNDKTESQNTKQTLIPKSSANHKSHEKCEDTSYLTDVGVALSNLGTTFSAVEDTVTNVPKTVDRSEKNNNHTSASSMKDIDIFENNQIHYSLQIPCEQKQTINKALKPPQTKCNKEPSNKLNQNTDIYQNSKDINNTMQDKHECINVNCSKEPKQVTKPNDAIIDRHARSSSPVIPCVTITVRTGQSKLTSNTVKSSGPAKKEDNVLLTKISCSQKCPQIREAATNHDKDNTQTKLLTANPSSIMTSQANLSKDSSNLIMKQPGTVSEQKSLPKPNMKPTEIDHDAYNRLLERKHKVTDGSINRLSTQVFMAKDSNIVKQSVSAENSAPAGNLTINRSISDQKYQNPGKSVHSHRIAHLPSGPTAIIFRKPPRLQPSQNGAPNQGQPIQTVVNNRPIIHQPIPPAGVAIRPRAPQSYPQPRPGSASNLVQVRPTNQNFIPQPRGPNGSNSRALKMGLYNWQIRFPQHSYSTGNLCTQSPQTLNLVPPPPPPQTPPPPPPPKQPQTRAPTQPPQAPRLPSYPPPRTLAPSQVPPRHVAPTQNPPHNPPQGPPLPRDPPLPRSPPPPQEPPPPKAPPPQTSIRSPSGQELSQDSIIGSMNGKLIKKINITKQTNVVDDKETMLLELNNAVMSPKLMNDEPKAAPDNPEPRIDPRATDVVKPKFAKPCPLSKKVNRVPEVIEKEQPKIGYSPPILPILTYQELMAQKDKYMIEALTNNKHNHTPFIPNKSNKTDEIKINSAQKRKIPHAERPYKMKKISFEDYRKRSAKDDIDRINESKSKKSKHVADDYNDQGYDSDSTVKL